MTAIQRQNLSPLWELFKMGPLILEKKLSKKEFIILAHQFPELRMERDRDGKTTIMTPVKFGSGKRELHAGIDLGIWWKTNRKIGEVFGPSTGIALADTSIKSPDCGWISEERLAQIPPDEEDGEYLSVAPDFIIEIRSKTDSLSKLKKKMEQSWMKNGVKLAWLIDPYKEKAYVYRQGKTMERVEQFDDKMLSGEDVLPGFTLVLADFKIKKRKK